MTPVDTCRSCGRSITLPGSQVPCSRCGSCVACGAVSTLIATAEDDDGPIVRCSVCGRDSRGYPGATGPVLRCIDPPQHRHLVLPLPFDGDRSRVATVGRSDLMHWPERSSATNAISRSHLRIRRDGAKYLVEDLSTNGTALRGEELVRGRPAEVHDGDQIALVTTGAKPVLVLEFCIPLERASSAAAAAEPSGPCPTCGASTEPGWAACPECGADLARPAPAATPEVAPTFELVSEAPAPRALAASKVPAAAVPQSPSAEVDPVALPDGDAPRFARAAAPQPPTPPAPRPAASSRQREAELDAEQTDGPAPSNPKFEEGLASLLKKAKPGEGAPPPRRKPIAK